MWIAMSDEQREAWVNGYWSVDARETEHGVEFWDAAADIG